MYFTVYKVTNKINGKFYIGKHQTNDLEDSYLGSGRLIKRAVAKYGASSFVKEILCICDSASEMDRKELELVTEELVKDPYCYNCARGGRGGNIVMFSENPRFDEYRERSRQAQLKISDQKSERTKQLHKDRKVGMYGKSQSDRQKQRVSEVQKGKDVSKDTRSKLSSKVKDYLARVGETQCPHCGKSYKNPNNAKRWHFDNCKVAR